MSVYCSSVSVCSPKSVKPAMCKLKNFQSKIQLECMQIEFSKVSISWSHFAYCHKGLRALASQHTNSCSIQQG